MWQFSERILGDAFLQGQNRPIFPKKRTVWNRWSREKVKASPDGFLLAAFLVNLVRSEIPTAGSLAVSPTNAKCSGSAGR
jgi:hypothetical protein